MKQDTVISISTTIIQAALEAVPGVGGSLSTLPFGVLQERRIKRQESFLKELSAKVNHIQNLLPDLTNLTDREKESLGALVERILEHVERETQEEKRKYFQNFVMAQEI